MLQSHIEHGERTLLKPSKIGLFAQECQLLGKLCFFQVFETACHILTVGLINQVLLIVLVLLLQRPVPHIARVIDPGLEESSLLWRGKQAQTLAFAQRVGLAARCAFFLGCLCGRHLLIHGNSCGKIWDFRWASSVVHGLIFSQNNSKINHHSTPRISHFRAPSRTLLHSKTITSPRVMFCNSAAQPFSGGRKPPCFLLWSFGYQSR